MRSKTCAIATAASLVSLILAGCGSRHTTKTDANGAGNTATPATTTAAAPATDVDPCSVLTSAEVAAITGDKVSHTEVIDHDCHYHTSLDDDGTVLSIYPKGGKDQMQSIRDANKMLGNIGSAVSAQGDVGKDVQSSITPPALGGEPAIGDEAVWSPNDVLAVRKGNAFVQVTPPVAHDPASHHGMLVSDADKRAISQKLAEMALARVAH